MKIETKKGINYSSFFFSFGLPFMKKKFNFRAAVYNSPDTWVLGYSSRTDQGKYVLFHDYDSLEYSDVIEEIRFLQKKFKLSDYYIFKLDRENSFHAVCLDTFSLAEAYNIQKATSSDLAFIHSIKNLRTKEWILRFSKKGGRAAPKFKEVLDSPFYKNIKSSAHAKFLGKLGIPVYQKGKWDNCEFLHLVKYNTANRTGD